MRMAIKSQLNSEIDKWKKAVKQQDDTDDVFISQTDRNDNSNLSMIKHSYTIITVFVVSSFGFEKR